MRLPAGYKLSLACARTKDEITKAGNLVDPVLSREGGHAYLSASNGFMAVVLRLDDVTQDDRDGWIPVEAIEGAEEHRTDEYVPLITAGEKDAIVVLAKRPDQTLIAARRDSIPTPLLDTVSRITSGQPEAVIRLNAKLLGRLAKAIGAEQVTLKRVPMASGGDSYAIVVERAFSPDPACRAILLPVKASEEEDPPPPAREKADPAQSELEEPQYACSRCGATGTTISFSISGGEPTPPVCDGCLNRRVDEQLGKFVEKLVGPGREP